MKAALLALVLACTPALARADEAPLARLFPHEAEIFVEGAGLARLVLPVEVLAQLRPDLSDVRVFDAAGNEVAFFVEPGAPPKRASGGAREAARVLAVERESSTPEGEPPRVRERYVLAPPEAPLEGIDEIELQIVTRAEQFVRTVRIGEVGAPPAEPAPLFRLSARSRRTRVALGAPARDVEVVIEGREDFYLEPRFLWQIGLRKRETPRAELPLAELSRVSEHGTTRIELARPPGLVPAALRFATSAPSFVRTVEIADVRSAVETRVGRGTIFRAALAIAVEELEVPLDAPALGDRLRLSLADRDSPPLDPLAVSAVVWQPSLVMALAPSLDAAPAGVLRFGGGRATRPRYDLADLWDVLERGREPHDTLRARARLGPVRANRAFDAAPALAFALHAGAPLDARVFEHARPVHVPAAEQGSVRVALDVGDVAAAREDLADVRVVDADDRQRPYLLEREATRVWVELGVERRDAERGRSRYALSLPAAPLRVDRVEISPDLGFIQREYVLRANDSSGRERGLASGRLALREEHARPLELAFPSERVASLELEIRDGDEAPLEIARARARVLLPELVLVAPAGDYTLLVGWPDATPPEYALEGVRDVVLAVSSDRAEPGALAPNPRFSARARLASGVRAESRTRSLLVWTTLVAAVVILALLTLRVARPG